MTFQPTIRKYEVRYALPQTGTYRVQSIHIPGHGTYEVTEDTLALTRDYLKTMTVTQLRKRMVNNFQATEGAQENPELGSLHRIELEFIAAAYPSIYVPGMIQALGLKVDPAGRFWISEPDPEPVYSATIFFVNGNQRYETGPMPVLILWAARYGVTLKWNGIFWNISVDYQNDQVSSVEVKSEDECGCWNARHLGRCIHTV